MSKNLATLIGFSAILQWSSIVGLLKKVSANIGADLAVLFMYSLSAVLLFALFRIPNLKIIPRKYLFGATALFVVYEICFSYAIALAQNAQQAIEISLVNYLWPSMTILMLILFKELNFNKWVILGLGISLAGVFYIQTGNGAIDLAAVISHMQSNPLSYGLAFVGASLWSLYCVMTKKYSQGHNPISLFFIATSLVLWLKMLVLHPEQFVHIVQIDATTLMYMLMVSTVTGLGYAAWNIGINRGNITMLVTLSYFSPIFSSIMSMWILQTPLSKTFWLGAIMVTLGSFVCWISTNWHELKQRFITMRLRQT
ncbi:aromatic amino acid DMT transporter YddG [Acinetobacter radioresistens]|jgi:drug/metabolite transporter (DMT)-like permease|uniref:aromatic amino acid DMT transporter YddG n=1 Tax=Acinetobacter radioresistens TaxID=40216 RepID=UPI00200459C2|nr:aromatic amino acid DMT transporter YddG [Acinetobacter radioresistens]MCK4087294.1 aromatic amino acid DMT transporter YddG [Acinetobacter radioresistens]MCX0330734.1 aromatic amino acid DMT transporter YddG [Acinetobacter radioresistens]